MSKTVRAVLVGALLLALSAGMAPPPISGRSTALPKKSLNPNTLWANRDPAQKVSRHG
jgi:hypothetical protein